MQIPQSQEKPVNTPDYYEHSGLDKNEIRRNAVRSTKEFVENNPDRVLDKIGEIFKNSIPDPNMSEQAIVDNIVAISRGFSGELLNNGITNAEDSINAIAISANTDLIPEGAVKKSAEQYYTEHNLPSRKDLFLFRIKLADNLTENNKHLLELIDGILLREQELRREWLESNAKPCTLPNLIRWALNNNEKYKDLGKKTKGAVNIALDKAYDQVYTDRKINGDNSEYFRLSLPDSFITDIDFTQIYAAVEVKSYTPEEVSLLAHIISLNDNEVPNPKGEYARLGNTKYGLDISGIRRMAYLSNRSVNYDASIVDLVDPLTAEVSQAAKDVYRYPQYNEDNFPVFVIFPEDAADDDILLIATSLKKRGYTNVIIQKQPFTSQDINLLSHHIMTHLVNKDAQVLDNLLISVGIDEPEKREKILEGITNKKNYVES